MVEGREGEMRGWRGGADGYKEQNRKGRLVGVYGERRNAQSKPYS